MSVEEVERLILAWEKHLSVDDQVAIRAVLDPWAGEGHWLTAFTRVWDYAVGHNGVTRLALSADRAAPSMQPHFREADCIGNGSLRANLFEDCGAWPMPDVVFGDVPRTGLQERVLAALSVTTRHTLLRLPSRALADGAWLRNVWPRHPPRCIWPLSGQTLVWWDRRWTGSATWERVTSAAAAEAAEETTAQTPSPTPQRTP
jgi:hypothetical protein